MRTVGAAVPFATMSEEPKFALPYPHGSLRRRARILLERYLVATLGVVAIDGGPASSSDLDRTISAARQTDRDPGPSRRLGRMRANWVGTDSGLLYITAGATHWTLLAWPELTLTPFVAGIMNRAGVQVERDDGASFRLYAKALSVANLLAISEHYGSIVQRDDD